MDLEHSGGGGGVSAGTLPRPPASCLGSAGLGAWAGPPHLDGPDGWVPEFHHALCVILQLVNTLLLGQQFVLLKVLGAIEVGSAVSHEIAPDTPHTLPGPVPTDLVLAPHTSGVRHEVAPILLQDAALLLRQGAQLPGAALQVCVQAAQALSAPGGRLLCSGGKEVARDGISAISNSDPREGPGKEVPPRRPGPARLPAHQ